MSCEGGVKDVIDVGHIWDVSGKLHLARWPDESVCVINSCQRTRERCGLKLIRSYLEYSCHTYTRLGTTACSLSNALRSDIKNLHSVDSAYGCEVECCRTKIS